MFPRCRPVQISNRFYVYQQRHLSVNIRRNAGTINRNHFLDVSEEVRDALTTAKPVVALETTIYTHGLPYPQNLQLSKRLEDLVRQNGAVPATIGVLDGRGKIGMAEADLHRLVQTPGARKLSRRDLGFALGSSTYGSLVHGGTTIAGTMILASLANIKVFATGGLGGVHRGGESSLDISADLTELGRSRSSPVAVIASGCKGFLDIPRTLEFLETQGVAVATFADGREGTIDFPAFWTRDSGSVSPLVVQDEVQAAAMIYAQRVAGIESSIFLANPIPVEFQIPLPIMAGIIEKSLEMAQAAGATGSANTPFILDAIRQLTDSKSVIANRALIEANVIRGALVAKALCSIEQTTGYEDRGSDALTWSLTTTSGSGHPSKVSEADLKLPVSSAQDNHSYTAQPATRLLVAGSVALDTSCDFKPIDTIHASAPGTGTSNPSTITQSVGGVGYNIARAAQLSGANTTFCSAIADDVAGQMIQSVLHAQQLPTNGLFTYPGDSARTAQYISFNDTKKDLLMAMADMEILETQNDSANELWAAQLASVSRSNVTHTARSWLAVDANWTSDRLHKWISEARKLGFRVAFEPVSTAKAARLFANVPTADVDKPPHYVDIITPNAMELKSLHDAATMYSLFERQDWWEVIDAMGIPSTGARRELVAGTSQNLADQGFPQMAIQLLPFAGCIITKLGAEGVLLTRLLQSGDPRLESAANAPYILSRSGTGGRNVGGIYMRLFPAVSKVDEGTTVSVNGAGDTFLGSLLAGLSSGKGYSVEDLIDHAQQASVLTLMSAESVSPAIAELRLLDRA